MVILASKMTFKNLFKNASKHLFGAAFNELHAIFLSIEQKIKW